MGCACAPGGVPFAASHSSARACCPHPRNLTDEMLAAMGERGCLVGLNYCPAFLDASADRSHLVSRVDDMVRHLRHMIDKARRRPGGAGQRL